MENNSENYGLSQNYGNEISEANTPQRPVDSLGRRFSNGAGVMRQDASGSQFHDEFGSAEAMEYTPSNTSQNNSIPTQLVTHSNSNLNLSNNKASFYQEGMIPSPSPQMSGSQVNGFHNQHNSFTNSLNGNHMPMTETKNINNNNELSSNFTNTNQNYSSGGANIAQASSISQSIPDTGFLAQVSLPITSMGENEEEEQFFENQASILIQQQRQTGSRPQPAQPQILPQSLTSPAPMNMAGLPPRSGEYSGSDRSLQQLSQNTTPAFSMPHQTQQTSIHDQNSLNTPGIQNQSIQSFQAQPQSQLQSLPQPQQLPQMKPPSKVVPHQTISLAGADNIIKLQQKIQEQAKRLQQEAQYKLLCEKRIKSLDPNHPLPVVFQHLSLPSFTPTTKQMAPQSNVHQEQQSRVLINHLQARVQDLTKQLGDKQQLELRLKQAEESLRKEVLKNEESRATINMLKDQLDEKIEKSGLVFGTDQAVRSASKSNLMSRPLSRQSLASSQKQLQANASNKSFEQVRQSSNSSMLVNQNMNGNLNQTAPIQGPTGQRPVDGLLQLASYSKLCDELKEENGKLKNMMAQQTQTMTQALSEQKNEFSIKLKNLETQLRRDQVDRQELNEQKDTLLDYAKDTMQKQQEAEEKIKVSERQKEKNQEKVVDLSTQLTKMQSELDGKQSLLDQVKANLEEMRADKIQIQAQVQTLTQEKETLVSKLSDARGSADREILDKEVIISKMKQEIEDIRNELAIRTREEQSIMKRYEEVLERERSMSCQLADEIKKSQSFTAETYQLKHTLSQSQKEMGLLVQKYDQAVEELVTKDKKIQRLQNDNDEIGKEIKQHRTQNTDLKSKAKSNEQEIAEVYSSLHRKNEVLKGMEQRLNQKLSEKDEEIISLKAKLANMQDTHTHENNQLTSLKSDFAEKLEVTIDLQKQLEKRDLEIRNLQSEMNKIEFQTARNMQEKDDEHNAQTREKEAKIYQLEMELKAFRDRNEELCIKNGSANNIVGDLNRTIEAKERELLKSQESLKRWEDEVSRLETNEKNKQVKVEALERDFDRVKSQQVDDAMLIEKLRVKENTMKEQINGIIGKITSFSSQLDDIGQTNLSAHIEQAYLIGRKIQPVDNEVTTVLGDMTDFLRALSQEIVTQLRNLPERDFNNQNPMVIRSDYNPDYQPDQYVFTTSQGDPTQRDPTQRDVTQRETFTRNTHHVQQFTLGQTDMVNINIEDEAKKAQDPLGVIEQSINQVGSIQSQPHFGMNSADLAAENSALKSQVTVLEENQLIEQENKKELEDVVQLILAIQILPNPFRLQVQDLMQLVRETHRIRRDKSLQQRNLLSLEKKFHSDSKMALSSSLQYELDHLRRRIQQERMSLHELDVRLQEILSQHKSVREDIIRANERIIEQNNTSHLQHKKLKEQLEDAILQNKDLKEQLTWTETRLNEQKQLKNMFKPREFSQDGNLRSNPFTIRDSDNVQSDYMPKMNQHRESSNNSRSRSRSGSRSGDKNIDILGRYVGRSSDSKTFDHLMSKETSNIKERENDDYGLQGRTFEGLMSDERVPYQDSIHAERKESTITRSELDRSPSVKHVGDHTQIEPSEDDNKSSIKKTINDPYSITATGPASLMPVVNHDAPYEQLLRERSKSPEDLSQASAFIRHKYHMRNATGDDPGLRVNLGANSSGVSSTYMISHKYSEPAERVHDSNTHPLRRSPSREVGGSRKNLDVHVYDNGAQQFKRI